MPSKGEKFMLRDQKACLEHLRVRYGNKNQIIVAIEELNELIEVVSKESTFTQAQPKVLDEVADAYIVLEHVKAVYGIEFEPEAQKDLKHNIYKELSSARLLEIVWSLARLSGLLAKAIRYEEGDSKLAPISARLCAMVVGIYSDIASISFRYSLKPIWIEARIESKVERIRIWLEEGSTFGQTNEIRTVRTAQEDMKWGDELENKGL